MPEILVAIENLTKPASAHILKKGEIKFERLPVVGTLQLRSFDRLRQTLENFLHDVDERMEWPGCNPGCFIVVMSGAPSDSTYPDGTLLLVDPLEIPECGDIVVAMVEGRDSAVVKRYRSGDKGAIELNAINPTGVSLSFSAKDRNLIRWWFPVLEAKIDLRKTNKRIKLMADKVIKANTKPA